MSFAAETKKELTYVFGDETCCLIAELSALIKMNGTVQLTNQKIKLDVLTENAAIARKIYTLTKDLFKINAELIVRKKMRLKKNNIYVVRIPHMVDEILTRLSIIDDGVFSFSSGIKKELISNDCCKRAYLRGAFLAGGSINNPESSSYHLEISSSDQEHVEGLTELTNEFGLNAKWKERKKGYFMYIKESEKITEFLSIIGAHQALFKFEDVRIVKDMRNSVNRLVNCETANLNKTIGAAMRQIENIQLIDDKIGLENLPLKLKEVAEIRVKYPELNLKEIGNMIPSGVVSKSGVNHRLKKIDEIAKKLRDNL